MVKSLCYGLLLQRTQVLYPAPKSFKENTFYKRFVLRRVNVCQVDGKKPEQEPCEQSFQETTKAPMRANTRGFGWSLESALMGKEQLPIGERKKRLRQVQSQRRQAGVA